MEVTVTTADGVFTPWFDELIIETIMHNLQDSEALARMARVCGPCRSAALAVGSRRLQGLLHRLQLAVPPWERSSPFLGGVLVRWERVVASNRLWIQATKTALTLERGEHVRGCADLSGNGCHIKCHANSCPTFGTRALNGHGVIEFDGSSLLRSSPFAAPLEQPVTIIVVAKARGDTTIVDSHSPRSSRFELCHGYPTATPHAAGPPQVVMTADGVGDESPAKLLRGATRSTGSWHVYTAIFDGGRSEMFVDGRCEGSGKNVGTGPLDGLTIGCDHSGVFHLKGAVAELRLFHCHLQMDERSRTEAALALRYGLSHASISYSDPNNPY